jgi:5-methylthioadenosine/S-adenosylhomocysteine deaminase
LLQQCNMAIKPRRPFTIVRGGKLLDIAKRKAVPVDILIKGDTIAEIGRPGLAAPAGATVIDAKHRLMHPGLINAHTHSPGNLAKGLHDRWSLELLLTASQWAHIDYSLEDKYLSAQIGAAEMVMKGCTAAYDLAAEFPLPSVEGLSAMAQAYEDVGMRCMLAPLVADISFFEAIPGLMERLPPRLRREVESFRQAPWKITTKHMRRALQKWPFETVQLALAPTIPFHCSDDFLMACRDLAKEYDVGIQSHVSESKVEAVAGYQIYGTSLAAHMDKMGLINERFTVAHGVWLDDDDMKRLGDRGASVAHNPGSNMRLGSGIADVRWTTRSMSASAPMAPTARITRTCTKRCGSPRWSRRFGVRTGSAGSAPKRRCSPPPKAAPAPSACTSRSAGSRRATRPTSSFSTCSTSTGSRPTIR